VFWNIAQKWTNIYLRKNRRFTFDGLQIIVLKDVFHPGLFRSTKLFARWLQQQPLQGKKVLELGCGTGMLSLVAAKNGALVTAIDINTKAVENVQINAKANHLVVSAYYSDLFDYLPAGFVYDMVLINPPYFPKDPVSDYEQAWFCGKDFNYFWKLYESINQRRGNEQYLMILSDKCDLASISRIAQANGFNLNTMFTQKKWGETFFIYSICKIRNEPAGV